MVTIIIFEDWKYYLIVAIGVLILIDLSIVIGYLRRLDDSLDILAERKEPKDLP